MEKNQEKCDTCRKDVKAKNYTKSRKWLYPENSLNTENTVVRQIYFIDRTCRSYTKNKWPKKKQSSCL